MHSEPKMDPPASILEEARKVIPNQDVLLVSDHSPSPTPEWVDVILSSTETLAARCPESRHTCGLILTPWIEPERLDAVIAHLRDFLSLELYVLHPGDVMEQTRRMGVLGLRCLEILDAGGRPWGLNHFSLKAYKKTPDWLNDRFWANPRLWDKFRW